MGLGRRKVKLHDQAAWVFNRMADVYDARPEYPRALVDALVEWAGPGGRAGDLGAGIGHLALPLAARGLRVSAVEPAAEMLERLRAAATQRGLDLTCVHAVAEELPLPAGSLDLVLVADALHFLDAQLAGREIGRVLAPGGALAVLTCDLGETPFMRALVRIMEESAPRRPRRTSKNQAQLFAEADVTCVTELQFQDETPVDLPRLERILRSISFVGPAMNPERFAAFRARVAALPEPPVWARTFKLRVGCKKR